MFDLLRGFALFGILVVNLPFLAHPIYTPLPEVSALDTAARWLIAFGGEAKFFVLFSFLFGYGLALQLQGAASRGEAYGARYARRLFGILFIGALHAVFLFTGDILIAYAVLGGVLWWLRDLEVRTLLQIAGVMIIVSALAYGLLGIGLAEHNAATNQQEMIELSDLAQRAYLGGWADNVSQRLQDLVAATPLLLLFNWPSALAMFVAGLAAGRARFAERLETHMTQLLRVLPWALLFGVAGNLAYASLDGPLGDGLGSLAVMMALAAAAPALSFSYVVGLIALWRSGRLRRLIEPLRSAGRMSLTNYIGQSLIAGILFNGYGLGWYAQLGHAACLGLAAGIFLLQVALSHLWLRYFRYGPEEWLLRVWTHWKWMPLRWEST